MARFVKKNKNKISELVDKDLNIINGDNREISTDITAYKTTDDSVVNMAQGISKYTTILEKDTVEEKLLRKEGETTLEQIPTIDSLKAEHPIIGKNLQDLIDSIKKRDVDAISDSIIINEVLNVIDLIGLPSNFKNIFSEKLKKVVANKTFDNTQNPI